MNTFGKYLEEGPAADTPLEELVGTQGSKWGKVLIFPRWEGDFGGGLGDPGVQAGDDWLLSCQTLDTWSSVKQNYQNQNSVME